jgi:Skp family chaperone for outer membrane proteins
MAQGLYTLPLSAHRAAVGISDIVADLNGWSAMNLNFATGMSSVVANIQSIASSIGQFNQLIQKLDGRREVPCESFVLFTANNNAQAFRLTYTNNSKAESFFAITETQNIDTAFKLIDLVKKHFDVSHSPPIQAQSDAIRFEAQAVSDLRVQVEKLGDFMVKMTKESAESTRKLAEELERTHQAKQSELEAEFKRRDEEFKIKVQAFEKAREDFDDRARTHVRRDLLDKIKENIKERQDVAIGKASSSSRLWVHVVSWVFLLISGTATAYTAKHLYEISGKVPFDWWIIPPFSASALTLVSTVIFYFRWISSWSDWLAYDGGRVSQYATDILRASWLVELLFEYKDEKGKEISPEVVSSLTEGLFKIQPFKASKYHPSDDMLRVVKNIKSLKTAGLEVETKN